MKFTTTALSDFLRIGLSAAAFIFFLKMFTVGRNLGFVSDFAAAL